jgi:hypothetical protein
MDFKSRFQASLCFKQTESSPEVIDHNVCAPLLSGDLCGYFQTDLGHEEPPGILALEISTLPYDSYGKYLL